MSLQGLLMAKQPVKKDSVEDELAKLRAEISKDLGQPIFFGSDEGLRLRKMPIGISAIDHVLAGGFAFDRVSLIVGEFSAGKTLLAMFALKAAQELGLTCAYIDGEKTWTEEWATILGVDASKVLVVRPRTGEDAFNAAVGLVRRKLGFLIIDSLASLRPTAEYDADESEMHQKKHMGGHAQLVGLGLSHIEAENQGTLVIAINQLRSTVGISYGNPETIPGGKAQQYIAWQLIRVRRGQWIEEEGKRVGYKLKVRVEKSKQSEPFRETEVPYYFRGEIDEIAGTLELGLEIGAITKDRSYYMIDIVNPDTGEIVQEKFYGRGRLLEAFKSRQDLQDAVNAKINSVEEIEL